LGVAVAPHHHALALTAVSRTHAEPEPHAMLAIRPDGTIIYPVRVSLFVAARPPLHMIDANRGDVEKLHLTLLDERRTLAFIPPR